jgi:hypothetical protein
MRNALAVDSTIEAATGRPRPSPRVIRTFFPRRRLVFLRTRRPGTLASTYDPLDSWVYVSSELIVQNYINAAFMGLRPWTRMDCARMMVEMHESVEAAATCRHESRKIFRCRTCPTNPSHGGKAC